MTGGMEYNGDERDEREKVLARRGGPEVESLIHLHTTFFADDAPATCRKILEWRRHLVLPVEARSKLTRNCVAFMASLLADRKDRCNSLADVRSHAWFEGQIDFEALRSSPAPRVPDGSRDVPHLLEELKVVDVEDRGTFLPLVDALTRNFDQPLHGAAAAFKDETTTTPCGDRSQKPAPLAAVRPPNLNGQGSTGLFGTSLGGGHLAQANTTPPRFGHQEPPDAFGHQEPPDAFPGYTYRRRRPTVDATTASPQISELRECASDSTGLTKHRADILASFESLTKRPNLRRQATTGHAVADALL
eukprot:CAMPEP_0118895418 /NCGR_PEP_ID=MMETSP1166-20130328/3780_1 /TAXON_ID=1104430 /ORGANISM="Chrysoreinhardia sp, Strain CCMP3193" /LENGTH=303 /DNA_ID=CAMNT_0006834441 /DNA_START=146 /DNA_END=1058 /DNA_ORIENTATION=+